MVERLTLDRISDRPVDEADFEEARSYVGRDLGQIPYNEAATRDTIRHFALGLGDENPLWSDLAYAKRTKFGDLLAPPSFILTHHNATSSFGLDRMLRLGSYWDITWSERIRCGDEFTATSTMVEPELIERHRGGYLIKQNGETVYKNQSGKQVARAVCGTIRIPKRGPGGAGYSLRNHSYSSEDIAKIEADILAEVVRGDQPRYADDVAIGETLQPVVKGPLTDVDSACWFAGYNVTSFGGPPLEIRVRSRAAEYMTIWADQWDGHVDPNFASEMGMPGAWMSGPGVYSWMCQLVTNWCGDDGFVERLTGAIRKPSVVGDTIWYRGKVTGVDGPRVSCRLEGTNQLGERVITGEATVLLPQR